MRRALRLLVVASLAVLGPLAACGDDDDDDDGGGGGPTSSDLISTEGVCGLLDADRVSEALGVEFDKAVAGEGSCTYTSSTSQTAFTLQQTDSGTNDPALVLETMAASCDAGTRVERTFTGAEGGFSCLAGGVPNVVAAAGDGVVLVLTGNSREEGVSPAAVLDDLVAVLGEAVGSLEQS